ncbi:hypothetical protein [Actinomadura rudentiformis]|uniref:Guanylate cyclase domain-containing protein n=1 Tax=Actinomadura rudentiformis TaxID=359158 RepID=A0A6H9Y648_9ACTN|nr:hypothetical protein [Actinomadura rudentiformis]KAB2339644.1 hypothetical protein F8566_47390 [Actinomadura rudentiformis]
MHDHPVPEYRVLFTVDIEDYSSRNDAEQRTLQSALSQMLDDAADSAELNRQAWERQHGGDGVYAILPAGTNVTPLMDTFVRELDAALGSYNRRRHDVAWSRLRLRMAVHIGPVHLNGAMGWPGQHAVQPARLRDSKPLRAAMGALSEADLGVIVSSEIYRDYITQGPGEPRPTLFRPVRVEMKKQSYTAYLYVPRFNLHNIEALAAYAPSSGTEGGDPPPAGRSPAAAIPADRAGHVNVAYGAGDAFTGDKVGGNKNTSYGDHHDG